MTLVVVRTTKKIVGPPDPLSWWSCGPLLIKVCVKPCKVLEELHASHQGMEQTKRRARLHAYWPGIDIAIERVVLACKPCSEALPSLPKEPIKFYGKPSRVFEHMSTDLFSHGGQNIFVVADVKSGWTSKNIL